MNRASFCLAGLLLLSGWLSNWVVSGGRGGEEWYPFTSWPMFSRPRREQISVFTFHVQRQAGAPSVRLPAYQMIRRGHSVGAAQAQRALRDLWGTLASPEDVPADLRETWMVNASKYLNLKSPPARIELVKYSFDIDGPATEGSAEPTKSLVAFIETDVAAGVPSGRVAAEETPTGRRQ